MRAFLDENGFRRLCAFVRWELRQHQALISAIDEPGGYSDLLEHLKCACARARLPYGGDVLTRVLGVVAPVTRRSAGVSREREESEQRANARRAFGPSAGNWRDECPHDPPCQTPTWCKLRTETGR